MKSHWPEYLTEGIGLGLFLLSAAGFGVLLFHPLSPAAPFLPGELGRSALMGLAMAGTALLLVHNRWGRQSGAHFNPALTWTFYHLGKVAPADALAYVVAQFVGGAAGMALAEFLGSRWLAHPAVNHVQTLPGPWGSGVAWLAEVAMTFVLMTVVLTMSASPRFRRFTAGGAAVCVFLFITFASPVSGMSLNPARSFATALAAGRFGDLWIYFTAPPLGMLVAAALHVCRHPGVDACAKLHHDNPTRCIFCEYQARRAANQAVRSGLPAPLTRV